MSVRPSLRAELEALQAELDGLAVVCDPAAGWPPALALRLAGREPAFELPCPYGDFAWVQLTEAAAARLGAGWDWRDLLNLASVEPELCR